MEPRCIGGFTVWEHGPRADVNFSVLMGHSAGGCSQKREHEQKMALHIYIPFCSPCEHTGVVSQVAVPAVSTRLKKASFTLQRFQLDFHELEEVTSSRTS